jgi:hypothetical protein
VSINYNFNKWRVSGETAEAWSPMAYQLISKNRNVEHLSGFRIGQVLYLHHIKGLSDKDINKLSYGYCKNITILRGILKGFRKKSVSRDSKEAYYIAMYMIEHEPEILERMYQM